MLHQVRSYLERMCTQDAPTAKTRGGQGSVDIMLEKEGPTEELRTGYCLPLYGAAAAALKFTIAGDGVTWQSIYDHSKAGRGQPPRQLALAPQAEPMSADAGDAGQPEEE